MTMSSACLVVVLCLIGFHCSGSLSYDPDQLYPDIAVANISEYFSNNNETTIDYNYDGECGTNLTARSYAQAFYSPDWPLGYSKGLRCEWSINAEPGERVELTFEYYNMELCCDHINIYDGDNIEQISGEGTQYTLVSRSRNLRIVLTTTNQDLVYSYFFFNSNQSQNTLFRFNATYKSINATSLDITTTPITTTTATIATITTVDDSEDQTIYPDCGWHFATRQPQTMDFYYNSCEWQILSSVGTQVQLQLHNYNMSLCCSVLQVYEGTNLLGEVRGQGRGVTFTSTGTNLTVKFKYYPDFFIIATYKEIDCSCSSDQTPAPMTTTDLNEAWNYNEETTTPEPVITTDHQGPAREPRPLIPIFTNGKCGFHVQANKSRQQINSPGYESNSYSNNLDCEWIITTNPKKPVRLVIEDFSTESCCDYLQILDGNTVTDTLRGLYPHRSVYTSTDGILKLRFYSDGSVVRQGFMGVFYEVQTPSPNDDRETTQYINATCGFNATATATPQTLNSPGYPEKYENNMYCTWRLTAQEGKQVKLTVGRFITERVDVLSIYDGNTLIQTLSGTHLQWLQHFYSTTRELIVVFRSNPYLTFTGFSASFIEIDE